jgi:hypothetical protein
VDNIRTQEVNVKRWLFLEENPALLLRDWMPPADEWPEFAEQRAEHESLLTQRQKAWDDACALAETFEAEDVAREQEVKEALREGREPDESQTTPPEQRADARREALTKWEQATDLLVEFLERVCAEIRERGGELYGALDAEASAIEANRAEAQRLLAEADGLIGRIDRKRFWLDRGTGRSVLGYYPFEQLGIPMPPEPLDLDALMAGGAVVEVGDA